MLTRHVRWCLWITTDFSSSIRRSIRRSTAWLRPEPSPALSVAGEPLACGRYDWRMTEAAESLLQQAMHLPAEDRALLASGLLASLDEDETDETTVEALWSAETERRARTLESGEATPVSWDHLVARIEERRS